jgi:uncharacterized protein (DUF983 family)
VREALRSEAARPKKLKIKILLTDILIIMLKHNRIANALRWKCPHCHEGDMYKSSIFEGIYNMHDKCPKCEQEFQLEPGFYWGAMYVGYALSSGYMLSGFAICIFGFGLSVNQSFALLIGLGLIMVPIIARTARALWLSMYVKYDKNALKVEDKQHLH